MIGKLKGTIDEIGEDHVVLDVHGVGYVAHCSARTLGKLGSAGEAAVLFIETYVREDQLKLFGFLSALEREWFRLLQSVQGVGSKVALAVLSTLTPGNSPTRSPCRTRRRSRARRAWVRKLPCVCHRTEEQGSGLRPARWQPSIG